MNDAGWIDRFIRHLEYERRLSPQTCKNYRRDLQRLAEWASQQGVADWAGLDSEHLRAFSASCYRKGLSARSIQRRLSAARTFFRYLLREKAVSKNPVTSVSAPKSKKRLPGNLDADRMARLLEIPGDGPIVDRDRAMLELLYSSGLRLAELVDLNLGDVDMHDATVRVTGKGNKDRIVPVGRQALKALRRWSQTRAELADADATALFVSNRGNRISHRSVQSRVKHWAKRQGIDANVYPHLFRHSFATHLLNHGADLRVVQLLLGHSDLSTTQIYTHIAREGLKRMHEAHHPRG